MCIIVYKPKGISVDRQTLETCFVNNPDGAGFMFPCEGRLLIKKGYFEFEVFWAAWEKCRKINGNHLPVVFHFRIATAGEIDKTNCHPHRIAHDLGFVHNGILSCVHVPKDSDVSDTIIYRNRYLPVHMTVCIGVMFINGFTLAGIASVASVAGYFYLRYFAGKK